MYRWQRIWKYESVSVGGSIFSLAIKLGEDGQVMTSFYPTVITGSSLNPATLFGDFGAVDLCYASHTTYCSADVRKLKSKIVVSELGTIPIDIRSPVNTNYEKIL